MLKKIKKRNLNVLKEERGFTLVEMVVVMGIIAFLLVISVGGLYSANKQAKVRAAAELFQATIREAANNSISVSGAIGDPSVAAKAWAVEVNADGTANLASFHTTGALVPGSTNTTLTKSTQQINLPSGVYASSTLSPITFIFSSPFAKFAYYTSPTSSSSTWTVSNDGSNIVSLNGSLTYNGNVNSIFSSGGVFSTIGTQLTTGESSVVY